MDEEAATVVRRIFAMTVEGHGPYQITTKLSQEKIEIPSVHLARYGEGVNKNKTVKDPYGWGSSVVVHILKKHEYLGHTINFKTQKHFKDKKSHYVDESEWTIFENTYEAIIDQETFDNVQCIRSNVKRYPDGWGEATPLTGLLRCADCGGKMYVQRINNGKRIPYYTCAQYGKVPVGTMCSSAHRIKESVVLGLVSDMLRAIADYARENRAELIKTEQEALAAEMVELEKAASGYEQSRKSAMKFIALVEDKYDSFEKLTITMLNEFVEKIMVHERARKGSIDTTQEVEIYFNFVGCYIPPHYGEVELTPEEQEAPRKKEELKDKRNEAYLRRKASGWQREYEGPHQGKEKGRN